MRRGLFWIWIGCAVVFLLVSSANPYTVFAQDPLHWSLPQRIRGIADDANPPYLLADQNRTVHAFFSQWIGNDLAVFYNSWTLQGGWTAPVDILLSPNKDQATLLGASLDSKGVFHVIFFGGIAEGAEIYYANAPAVSAVQARAWSQPRMIGDGATSPASGSIVGDDKGNLFVLYSGKNEGYGIYGTLSTDYGAKWSSPTPLFLTRSSALSTCCLQMFSDDLGWVHAVWLVVDKNGQGRGVYYARLSIRDMQWSFPIALAETPGGLGVRDPSIVEHQGTVFAAFYDADFGGHLAMRTSSDEGANWSALYAPFPRHIGANGAGSFVIDSNSDLHLFWGERTTGNPDIHGIWHSVWQGDKSWSEPEAVISGPQTAQFDPSAPKASISQGNVFLVTWRQDPGLVGTGVSFSYVVSSAPQVPARALPTSAVTPAASPIVTLQAEPLVPTRTPFPRPAFTPQPDNAAPGSLDTNPNIAILMSVIPILLILLVLVVIRQLRGSA